MKRLITTWKISKLFSIKFIRIMKLSLVFLFACIMQISASVYSQGPKISINFTNTPLRSVLNELEKETNYTFFYNEDFTQIRNADLMKIYIEDDWDPEIKKKDSILNKVVVNFSSKIINYDHKEQIKKV